MLLKAVSCIFQYNDVMSYESPQYEVIHKEGAVEIRSYQEFYTSSVREDSLGGDSGFNVLFSYISGYNRPGKKMAMTIPVINEVTEPTMTMEFVIPREFYERGIPQPSDPNVVIKHYPAGLVAAIAFSGLTRYQVILKQHGHLLQTIKDLGYEPISGMRIARFNSPFSLPFMRHNEVQVAIRKIKP